MIKKRLFAFPVLLAGRVSAQRVAPARDMPLHDMGPAVFPRPARGF